MTGATQPLDFREWGRQHRNLAGTKIPNTPEGQQQLNQLRMEYDQYLRDVQASSGDPAQIFEGLEMTENPALPATAGQPRSDLGGLLPTTPSNPLETLPELVREPEPDGVDVSVDSPEWFEVLVRREMQDPGSAKRLHLEATGALPDYEQIRADRLAGRYRSVADVAAAEESLFAAVPGGNLAARAERHRLQVEDVRKTLRDPEQIVAFNRLVQANPTTDPNDLLEQTIAATATGDTSKGVARTVKDFTDAVSSLSEVNPELANIVEAVGSAETVGVVYNQLMTNPKTVETMALSLEKKLKEPLDKKDDLGREEREESKKTVFDTTEQVYLLSRKEGKVPPVVPIGLNLNDNIRDARIVEAGDRGAVTMIENEDGTVRTVRMTPEASKQMITELAEKAKAARNTDATSAPSEDSEFDYALRGAMELGSLAVQFGSGVAKAGKKATGNRWVRAAQPGKIPETIGRELKSRYGVDLEQYLPLKQLVERSINPMGSLWTAKDALAQIGRAAKAKDEEDTSK